MIIRLTVEETGWPVQKTTETAEAKTVSELVEALVEEGILPESGDRIYLLHKAETDEEMAAYYPFVKKVIQLREEKKTLRAWFPGNSEGEIRVQVYEGWEGRLAELDPDGTELAKEKSRDSEDREPAAWGPKEKELTLLKLMKSLGGEAGESYARSAGWELWLYLLGFVLVMAFLVSSLTQFINGDAEGGLARIIGNRALVFLIPAAVCFIAGKLSEVIAKKKKQ